MWLKVKASISSDTTHLKRKIHTGAVVQVDTPSHLRHAPVTEAVGDRDPRAWAEHQHLLQEIDRSIRARVVPARKALRRHRLDIAKCLAHWLRIGDIVDILVRRGSQHPENERDHAARLPQLPLQATVIYIIRI